MNGPIGAEAPHLVNALHSIKTKLVVSIMLFVVVSSSVMAYLVGHFVQSRMEPAIGTQHYLLMQGVAKRLDQELTDRIDDLRALGELVEPVMRAGHDLLLDRMAASPTLTHQFWNVGLIDLDGNVLANLRGPAERKLNIASREYFKEVVSRQVPVVSNPVRSALSGKPMTVIIVPILVNGQVKGYVGGSMDLDGQQLVDTLLGNEEHVGLLMLIGGDGSLISHPNPALVMHPASQALGRDAAVFPAVLEGTGWTIRRDAKGNSAVYSSVKLKNADWTVVGSYPYQEEFSALEAVRSSAVACVLALVAVTGAIGAVLAYRFVAPLRKLQREVVCLDAGILQGESLHTDRRDEIGALSNQFYRLVGAREADARRMRAQQLFLRTLLAGAPDAVVLANSRGEVIEWNLRAQEIFGWSAGEAIGRSVADLIVPEGARSAHLNGMARFAASSGERKAMPPARLQAQRKDGSKVMVELSLAKIAQEDGVAALAFIRDVTTQIEREERIVFSERRLKMIADNIPALIAYIDQDERYAFSNAHYKRLLGIVPSTMIGRRVADVLGPPMYERLREHMHKALSGDNVHFEISRTDLPATKHFMADFIADTDEQGNTKGFYTLVTDITERKEAEMRQAESERKAAAANRAKSEFVANISHEIRTPMNAVLGIAQLLENTPLENEQREYVGIIRASGLSLIAILNDVLDFSKIEAGRMEIEHERYDIEAIIDSAAALLAASGAGKDIEVLVGLGASMPRYVIGDFVRVQQVVTNLLSNAVKFTHKGYVALLIETSAEGKWLRLTVDDTGIGITKAQQERIFESFTQADTSTTRKFGGTGLGLTITRRLVDMMGGSITLTSAPGEGSMFHVKLPLDSAPQEVVKTKEMGLLLIDDCERSRQLFLRTCAYCRFSAAAYASLGELKTETARGTMRVGAVSMLLISASQRAQVDAIHAVLAAEGLGSSAETYFVETPFNRGGSGQAGGDAATANTIRKPITPKVLRKLAERSEPSAQSSLPVDRQIARLRILLVEDNPVNQMITKAMLAGKVAHFEMANNGEEGVAILRAHPDGFDVVMMDVQMPVMDGFEATRAIRQELGLHLPIVAMTAGVFAEEVERCAAAGMDEFLPKPVVMDEMFDLLRRLATQAEPPANPALPKEAGHKRDAFSPTMLQTILDKNPSMHKMVVDTVRDGLIRTEQEMTALQTALQASDVPQAKRLLHSIRGALGNLGAHRFAVQALEAQLALENQQTIDLAPLQDSMAQFSAAAEQWLSEHAPTAPAQASLRLVSSEEFAALLRSHDYRALEMFDQLKPEMTGQVADTLLAQLGELLAALNFEDALRIWESEVMQSVLRHQA